MVSPTHPWLSIPAEDYEGHMADPRVAQLQFLNESFGELLREFEPETISVLGCATGNGFEHLRPDRQRTVVGIDLNPEYLGILVSRFGKSIPELELHCMDLALCDLEGREFDFIYGGLFLEYLDPEFVLQRCSRWLKRGGIFATILQLPSPKAPKVSETGVESVKRLDAVMTLVKPEELSDLTASKGLRAVRTEIKTLESGKEFFVGIYSC